MTSFNPFSDNPPPAGAPTINPYASPSIEALGDAKVLADNHMRKLVKDFRSQMHSLGALWIILGVLGMGMGLAILFLNPTDDPSLRSMLAFTGILTTGFGLLWAVVGVFTCLKQMWAVYVGLVLSYLGIVGNVLSFNLTKIIPLVILGAAILQGHRVIGWAKELTRKGIPLTARPDMIQTPINLPMQ